MHEPAAPAPVPVPAPGPVRTRGTARALAALAVPAVPLFVLVLPTVLGGAGEHATAESQLLEWTRTRAPYELALLQAVGFACLVPACLGVLAVARERARGTALAAVTAVLGCLTAFAMLLVMGAELAQLFFTVTLDPPRAGVDAALLLNDAPGFVVTLLTGLSTTVLTLPLLGTALRRSRVLSTAGLLSFLVPLIVSFLPLPPAGAELAPGLGLLVPCCWIAVRVAATRPAGTVVVPAGDRPARRVRV
ncbi:hypothetical protein [Kineococcus terrestris]|uniref:hypothetical protein n=1 Tax=Kineococcus terrestris TaxID=2044856 RepID=UPI0034DB10E6